MQAPVEVDGARALDCCDVERLLARCAYEGVLVHACDGRLRVRAAGPHPFGNVLRARHAELVEHLVSNPPPVMVDFETLSAANLTKVGGRRYAQHNTTEVLCAVALSSDGELVSWAPGQCPPARLFEVARQAGIVAHNAQLFDRWIWETTLGWPTDLPWQDSHEVARVAGLPGGLEGLALLLPGAAKDTVGSTLVKRLNQKYARSGLRPELSAEEGARIAAYCASDVFVLARVVRGLLHGLWSSVDADVRQAHTTIQRRGFAIDQGLAGAILDVHERVAEELSVPGVPIRSNPQLRAWLVERGVEVGWGKGALDAAAVGRLLERADLTPDVRRALEARLFETAIAAKKIRTALKEADPDGRIREAFRYCGAHTGRWTAVGLQPHNLPRGFDADVELRTQAAVDLALARDVDGLRALAARAALRFEELLGALVRPCIVGSPGRVLGVVDYAQIEARVLVWLAGDEPGMQDFREGHDVYARMAERLCGAPSGSITKADPRRKLGKVVVLGLGYGMGPRRFREHAAAEGIDWSAIGLSPEHVVDAWRDAAPLIAGARSEDLAYRRGGLWQRLNRAARRAVRDKGGRPFVGALSFRMQGGDLLCVLPSGRFLRYPEARLERAEDRDYDNVVYRGREKRRPGYGGLWTENAVQAIARDLIAGALVRLEAAGLPVVMHVHDEVVCELDAGRAEEDLRRMVAICEELPPWAEGLPLKAEGFCSPRYRKG
jgi:DNA polymerase